MNTMVKFSVCTLSDEELVKKVDKLTDEMFQKQEVPTRNIPAEPNNDYDLLVGELIVRFSNQVQAVVSLNFAKDEKKIILDALTEVRNEYKRMISYKYDVEGSKKNIITIDNILSKISA